jgi:hypothetical protein
MKVQLLIENFRIKGPACVLTPKKGLAGRKKALIQQKQKIFPLTQAFFQSQI